MTDDATTTATSAPAASTTLPTAALADVAIGKDGQELTLGGDRVSVTELGRTVLDLRVTELRRIQFDIERGRPATLVIVPDRATNAPQVVVVPAEQFDAVGRLLSFIGRRLDDGTASSR
jgi:hypothetical protein